MKQPQLSHFTPSTTHPFNPKRVFYIHTHPTSSSLFPALSHSSTSSNSDEKKTRVDVFEITSTALTNPEPELNLKAQLTDPNVEAHTLTALVPKLEHLAREVEAPFLTVQRGGWYHRFFEATLPQTNAEESQTGAENKEVIARLDGPLLDMGHWKLTFTAPGKAQVPSPVTVETETGHTNEQRHEIELRPTGPGSTTDCFVMNSVPYIWEMVHGREVFRLWRCGMAGSENDAKRGTRREVGVYIVRNARSAGKEGVLVLDDDEKEGIDLVVGIMTCLGTVNRSDSFRK
ncbi:hypothetical protein V8F06_008287 [Rhypophila decipiens]